MHAMRVAIVILLLFAVRNKRRACGCNFIERSGVGILAVGFCDSLDEINESWDSAIGSVGIVIGACLAILAALRQEI